MYSFVQFGTGKLVKIVNRERIATELLETYAVSEVDDIKRGKNGVYRWECEDLQNTKLIEKFAVPYEGLNSCI